jgi:hypothetical protein
MSSGSPITLNTWPRVIVADRHGDAGTGVAHLGAAGEAVGGLQADGPHPVVADLLGDLGPHLVWACRRRRWSSTGTWLISGIESGGNSTSTTGPAMVTTRPSLQLDRGLVGDGHDCSPVGKVVPVAVRGRSGYRYGLGNTSSAIDLVDEQVGSRWRPWRKASAPPTISMISVVMASWRARFMTRL